MNVTPKNGILVTADVVGLYPNIPHQACLEGLREALDKRETHKVSMVKVVKMAEFILENNYFQFLDKFYQYISETAISTKFSRFVETDLRGGEGGLGGERRVRALPLFFAMACFLQSL